MAREPVRNDLHVVLVEPEIHHNTGNAGRLCLATGAQLHLVEPLGFSLDARQVRRAGLDYWKHVHPRVWPDWPGLESDLQELGDPYFFSAEGKLCLWDIAFPSPVALVFGRESVGLPADVRRRYRERLVRIPVLPGTVRSLNLANSVALAVYEVLRQRQSPQDRL